MYHVRILEDAVEDLKRLDKAIGRRIVTRINWLATNLDNIRPEALTGHLSGFYKLRAGDDQIFYEILYYETTSVLHQIGHRRDIYRRR